MKAGKWQALLLVLSAPSWAADLYDDWVPDPNQGLCHGAFQPTNLPDRDDDHIMLTSDETQIQLEGTSLLKGHVEITKNQSRLRMPELELLREETDAGYQHYFNASGPLTYETPLYRVMADEGIGHVEKFTFDLKNTYYHNYGQQTRGQAALIHVYRPDRLSLTRASYTGCAPDQNIWSLSAKNIDLNFDEGQGHAYHTTFKLWGVPVIYTPYFGFPLDDRRMSGFLYPNFGSSTQSGYDVEIPYYFNLAPNYDSTIRLQWLQKRGIQFKQSFRHLSKHSDTDFRWIWLPNDRAYEHYRYTKKRYHPLISNDNDPRITGLKNTHRYAFGLKHHGQVNAFKWQLDYYRAGDNQYFLDLGNYIGSPHETALPRKLEVNYEKGHYASTFKLQDHQVLNPFSGPLRSDSYRQLPHISVEYNPIDWFHFDAQSDYFTKKRNPITHARYTKGLRLHTRPQWRYTWQYGSIYVKPSVSVDGTYYNLSLSAADQNTQTIENNARWIPIYNVDAGTLLSRQTKLLNQDYIQTLEPRLFFLYVPNREQNQYPIFDSGFNRFSITQLNRINRFSGYDRLGDTHEVTFSLKSRLLDKTNLSEHFELLFGQVYYFRDRHTSICDSQTNSSCLLTEQPTAVDALSPLVGQLTWRPISPLQVVSGVEWNHQVNAIDSVSATLEYHDQDNRIFNLSHRYLRIDPERVDLDKRALKQSTASFAWPISERWQTLGRWSFDQVDQKTIDALWGFQYNHCCVAVQLVGQIERRPFDSTQTSANNQYNKNVYVQVGFKGLGKVGHHDVDGVLQQMIAGYQNFDSP